MTAIESLWALYSDGWWSKKTMGSYPSRQSSLLFPGQTFYTRNKQGAVRALRFREHWVKEAATFLSWAVSSSQGPVVFYLSPENKVPNASTCPQEAIFSSAPGGQLFSQEPGKALSVVSETKALTYTLLARLTTFYLKVKFSKSWVPYQVLWR